MEKQTNTWKFISIFGIPVTAILTWVFVAGGIVQDVKNNIREIDNLKTTVTSMDSRLRTTELGMARIDEQYKNICASLSEIKEELKKGNK